MLPDKTKIYYKEYMPQYIGGSDIATLIVVGMRPEYDHSMAYPVLTMPLPLGEDGDYRAHVIDERAELPSHYKFFASFSNWIKIYDDTGLAYEVDAPEIELYRAGKRGILIRVIGKQVNTIDEIVKANKARSEVQA